MITQLKWYTVKVTPTDEVREPYEFLIETSNLKKTMGKYVRSKVDGDEDVATWEIIR